MRILFVCTSNKDRSPALESFFKENHPEHLYRSAGVNKYFTDKKQTHYITQEDIDWSELIVFAEMIHCTVTQNNFKLDVSKKHLITLGYGEYKQGCVGEDYLLKAENYIIKHVNSLPKPLKS